MLKVAIVGCGKIADQHVHAIRRIPDCKLVGVCDREPLMAKQLGERFGISACFGDVTEMVRAVAPDVVHITTPPQNHCMLAKECLNAGSHVYLEKPFTVTAEEAKSLIQLADHANLKVTAGHNLQFTLEMMEMRRLVNGGFLGGRPVHVESYFSYDLGDKSYAGAFLGILHPHKPWNRKSASPARTDRRYGSVPSSLPTKNPLARWNHESLVEADSGAAPGIARSSAARSYFAYGRSAAGLLWSAFAT